MYERILTTVGYIKLKTNDFHPEVGVVLGSGLGGLASGIDVEYAIPYSDIPNFPVSTVKGHQGQLLLAPLPVAKSSPCKAVSTITKAIR